MLEWLFKRGLQEREFHERLPVITQPTLAQGVYLWNHQRANYLLRHNDRSQPEVVGRVEHQGRYGNRYTVSVIPLALLPDREKQALSALLAPYQHKEAREQSIEEAIAEREQLAHAIVFIDFREHLLQEPFPENVITDVFTPPSIEMT